MEKNLVIIVKIILIGEIATEIDCDECTYEWLNDDYIKHACKRNVTKLLLQQNNLVLCNMIYSSTFTTIIIIIVQQWSSVV